MKQLALALTLALALLIGEALAAPAVVRLVQAPAWRVRGGERIPLRVGLELDSGDSVHTGSGARALLSLQEGSLVKLGEQADLALADMQVQADDNGVFTGFLNVLKGAFRFTTTLTNRKRDIRAQLRSATIGIRGTDVWGKAEDARDFVVLLEGSITIERGGQSYQLDTPLSLFVAPRGQPADPVAPVDSGDLSVWAQETEPQANQGVQDTDGRYRLNLASYSAEAGATRLQQELALAGYSAETEQVNVGGQAWWRVIIPGYAARADAQSVAERLRVPFHLASPWVSANP